MVSLVLIAKYSIETVGGEEGLPHAKKQLSNYRFQIIQTSISSEDPYARDIIIGSGRLRCTLLMRISLIVEFDVGSLEPGLNNIQ